MTLQGILTILLVLFILYIGNFGKIIKKNLEQGGSAENFPFPEPPRHTPQDERNREAGYFDDYAGRKTVEEPASIIKKYPQNKKDIYSLEKIEDFYAGTRVRPAVSELDNYESELGVGTENFYSGTRMRPTVSEFDNYTGEFGAKPESGQGLNEALHNIQQKVSSGIDAQDFDLRRAVIYSEILNSKYKEL